MKKLSVILSCYRGDELIQSYIDCLLSSSFLDSTTLIVLDFPFSHSDPSWVKEQLRRYPDLVLIEKLDNISLYDAWNVGISIANTEYVANLNLDDRVSCDYYEEAVGVLDKTKATVYSSRAYSTEVVGQVTEKSRLQKHLPDSRFTQEQLIEYGIEDLVYFDGQNIRKNCVPHCAPVWRRSLNIEIGYFSSVLFDFCADYEFWLRAAANGARFLLSKEAKTIFYCAPNTASDKLIHESSEEIVSFWSKHFPPRNYQETHLGRRHDLLHLCMNLNAIFSNQNYYLHLPDVDVDAIREAVDRTSYKRLREKLESLELFHQISDRTDRVREFRNSFKGKKALLLCNGPSLNKVDFNRIPKSEYVIFGLNKIFLGFDRLGVVPQFLVAVNEKVISQSKAIYTQTPIVKFISNRVPSHVVPNGPMSFRINTTILPKPAERFSHDASLYVHEGWTVTHAALQIISYMGFDEAYIVGMDHNFSQHKSGQENQESVIEGMDADHFDPSYFGGGQKWDFPDLLNSEISYRAALHSFSKRGAVIFDCTEGGKCDVFPKLPSAAIYLSESQNSRTANRNAEAKPKISVICPFKNPGSFFSRSIESVIQQSERSLELLLIDDGSTDYSRRLACHYSKIDERITVVSNKYNPGVSGARNTGLELARGQFIAFLDADDYYYAGTLTARIDAIKNKRAEIVHCRTRMVSQLGADLEVTIGVPRDCSYADCYTNPAHLNGILGKAELLKKFRFNIDLRNGEDWLYLAQIMRSGASSHFLNEIGAIYRVHSESAVNKDPIRHDKAVVSVLKWLYAPLNNTSLYPIENQAPLMSPSFDDLILARELNSFLTAVFTADLVTAELFLSSEKFISFLQSCPVAKIVSRMTVPFVRIFQVPRNEVKVISISDRMAVLDVAEKLAKKYHLPNLLDALREGLKTGPDQSDVDAAVVGSYSREASAHWDETLAVHRYLRSIQNGVMIDVGAHEGYALMPFLEEGWKVFAFEPDNKNRTKLLARLAEHRNASNVTLDARCVSNQSQSGVSFFTSEQSTGISGLSVFHETHKESQKVDITTLSEFFKAQPLPAIDFLKIDTEGHDLFVLQGYPWERGQPAVIECEFEDTKTVPLGYTFQDLASYLVDKGYQVYVSEWHPIIRYGIRHDWRALMRYPCDLADPKGWGNLLAFRDPVDETALAAAVKKVLKLGTTVPAQARANTSLPTAPVAIGPLSFRVEPGPHYAPIGLDQWRYTHSEAKQRLWMATLAQPIGPGQAVTGGLRIQADREMTVNVTLGRHGSTPYQGTTQRLQLVPGQARVVILTKTFDKPHTALRLQVEVLALPDGGTATLTITDLKLTETPESLCDRLGVNTITLAEANRRLRAGEPHAALSIYLSLYKKHPLAMYEFNAIYAAQKAGLGKFDSLQHLCQSYRD